MKLVSLACVAAALALPSASAQAAGGSGKNKPGYCNDDKGCPKGYSCVSVQTTRDGITDVKQCLPTTQGNQICTGIIPGLCPSFSTTWGTSFRQIASVCAYIIPEAKGVKCQGAQAATKAGSSSGASATTNSTKGMVECLNVKDPSDETKTVGVIYGCVDFDGKRLLFDKTLNPKSDKFASSSNYSAVIAEGCVNPKNPQGSTFVCSSQGTCAPNSPNSMDYSCKCNVGFSGKYCEKIVSNKCYNDGVCGGGRCDTDQMICTKCPPGTMGDKCAQCDPAYDSTKVCGGHGKCVAASGDSTLGTTGSSSGTTGGSSGTSSGTSTSGGSTSKSNSTSSSTTSGSSATASSSSGAGTVKPSNSSRLLASSAYQCQCDEGWSDTQCGVKLKAAASNSSTPAPSSSSMSPATVTVSISAVALTVAAVFSA